MLASAHFPPCFLTFIAIINPYSGRSLIYITGTTRDLVWDPCNTLSLSLYQTVARFFIKFPYGSLITSYNYSMKNDIF